MPDRPVKNCRRESYVSYGRAYRAERPTRIAVIPVGYADGFRRAPAQWGEVLVRGAARPSGASAWIRPCST